MHTKKCSKPADVKSTGIISALGMIFTTGYEILLFSTMALFLPLQIFYELAMAKMTGRCRTECSRLSHASSVVYHSLLLKTVFRPFWAHFRCSVLSWAHFRYSALCNRYVSLLLFGHMSYTKAKVRHVCQSGVPWLYPDPKSLNMGVELISSCDTSIAKISDK